MTYTLIIEPEAEADIFEAWDWYENRQPGLGGDFQLCLDAAMETVRRNPQTFRKVYKNARRFMVRRFPYGIFYIERKKVVTVFAVFHSSRDPKSWQSRAD